MNYRCNFSIGVIAAFLLSGSFTGCSGYRATYGTDADVDRSSRSSTLASCTTQEQRKMFGPFPDWSMQEGQYRCKLFSMRYLIDGETGLRDRNKSWIAVLYCDEKLPCRYMLKFSIRKRSQKGGAWQEMDKGSVSFEVRDGNVQSVGQAGNCHPKSTIDIAVREDSETQRYIQMRMSDGKHNDELRFGIDVGEAVKRL